MSLSWKGQLWRQWKSVMVQERTPAGTMKSSSTLRRGPDPPGAMFERGPAKAAGGPVWSEPEGAGGLPMLSQRKLGVTESNARRASHSGADVSWLDGSLASRDPASTPTEKDSSVAAIRRPAVRAAAGERKALP